MSIFNLVMTLQLNRQDMIRIIQSFYHIITTRNEVSQVCAEHYIVMIELQSHRALNKVETSEHIIIDPLPP